MWIILVSAKKSSIKLEFLKTQNTTTDLKILFILYFLEL